MAKRLLSQTGDIRVVDNHLDNQKMKKTVTNFVLPVLVFVGIAAGISVAQFPKNDAQIDTQETLIVDSGSIELQLDVNRLNGLTERAGSAPTTLRFHAAPDSFFQVVAYNNELRGPTGGSIVLVPENSALLPAALNASFNQLVIERMSDDVQELVIRDAKSGFVFFNLEGMSYDYDAAGRMLQFTDGRLVISESFAKDMGRPSDAGTVIGGISLGVSLRLIETRKVVNGAVESTVLPAADAPNSVPGPDVMVGDLPAMQQVGNAAGGRVGVVVATTSCNNGQAEFNWFAMPNTDHPVIPQNLYRMSGGADNAQRFEQIGQSWLKHAFTALQQNACGFGCQSSGTGTRLGVGCSDPYSISNNASQGSLGSRAWVNPFTGAFPSNAREHGGHTHDDTSHRTLVNISDLNTTLNVGATYYAEGQYVTPHEYAWCQGHPGECNMYNNVSYRRYNVTGTTSPFTFSTVAGQPTVRQKSAIEAWTGATINRIEPAPGTDGQGFIGYKVSGPVDGMYHYEYAVYNQNLDRAVQSFSVPVGCGTAINNVGFHAPPNHPPFANDNIGGTGLSNAAWTPTQTSGKLTWATETFAQNANANAIRWGTMYNFRFDSDRPPQQTLATVGFFKTGEPITVAIQAPSAACTALQAVSAVSRKMHGELGAFDIPLPFSGQPGVESRRSSGGNHRIVFTFTNEVVSGNAAVTEGTGSVLGSPTFSGNTMSVVVTGVPNAQRVGITLNGVTDNFAQTLPETTLVMKALFGDTDGNSSVTASDIGRVKSETSNAVSGANFRSDLTADGAVNASDIGAVKSMAGTTLP
jgi:hypothetical protein